MTTEKIHGWRTCRRLVCQRRKLEIWWVHVEGSTVATPKGNNVSMEHWGGFGSGGHLPIGRLVVRFLAAPGHMPWALTQFDPYSAKSMYFYHFDLGPNLHDHFMKEA